MAYKTITKVTLHNNIRDNSMSIKGLLYRIKQLERTIKYMEETKK